MVVEVIRLDDSDDYRQAVRQYDPKGNVYFFFDVRQEKIDENKLHVVALLRLSSHVVQDVMLVHTSEVLNTILPIPVDTPAFKQTMDKLEEDMINEFGKVTPEINLLKGAIEVIA
jgi:hypothetical protein